VREGGKISQHTVARVTVAGCRATLMVPFDPALELKYVSERNLRQSVGSLNGYLKFASMIWIRALRQPILDAVIVKRWSMEAGRAVSSFCHRHGCDEVLLRIDTLNKRWSERRGGYIIPGSKVRSVLRDLNSDGKIAAFLEPASPYRDRYCLAAITDDKQEKVTVEVVGPGFDASDLLRSDSLPHERFEAFIPRNSRPLLKVAATARTYVVRSEDYTRSVDERLVKIGARLRNPAFPKGIVDAAVIPRAQLAKEAIEYLKRTKQAALLNHLDAYDPIPRRFLERFVAGIGIILDGLSRYNVRLGATSFSGTFTARGRFVFWDFFPADLSKAGELYLSSRHIQDERRH
jgi:hypothetical protein